MWFIYILECKNGSLYTGSTNNIERRFAAHVKGKGGHYTSSRGAKKILYAEEFATRSESLKREAQIKSWRREEKLKLIKACLKK